MTHGANATRLTPSVPPSPGLASSLLRLLAYVDDLPGGTTEGATGALRFGEQGMILLQNRRICWAVARGMRLRLTDILLAQSSPPLSREAVEALYRRCHESGTPLGEALVASGMASEAGLRAALRQHNGEAILALARSGAVPESFVSHVRPGYDPRFSFAATELLVALGAREEPGRAAAAQAELSATLVEETTGAAFTRSNAAAGPLLVAVDENCDIACADLVAVCNWISSLFDLARIADPATRVARLAWGARAALVTWCDEHVSYVGFCQSRAAAARLLSRLSQRGAPGPGRDCSA